MVRRPQGAAAGASGGRTGVRVRVVWVGRPGVDPFHREVAAYLTRVARRWPAEDVPLRPAAGGRASDPDRARAREGEAIRARVPDRWLLVALDERGWEPTSEELASWLGTLEGRSVPGVAFAVGSDLGLDPGVCEVAARRLSLGRLTLPHRLARLVLWEQLYRATAILGGGAYHRAG